MNSFFTIYFMLFQKLSVLEKFDFILILFFKYKILNINLNNLAKSFYSNIFKFLILIFLLNTLFFYIF